MTSTAPSAPDSVRLALPSEAAAIAAVQRRAWVVALPEQAAQALLADVAVSEMTDVWRAAIVRPPAARFRVLVALERSQTVAFAATVPSPDPDAQPGRDGLVEEFVVDPSAQRRGHGSRLLHACADTLRADGFSRATWWVSSTDDVLRRFLAEAGWAPDGGSRTIGTDDESIQLKQIRMHTDLTSDD